MVACRRWSLIVLRCAWLTLFYLTTLAFWHGFLRFFLDNLVINKLFKRAFQRKRLLNLLIWIQNSFTLRKNMLKWHVINECAVFIIMQHFRWLHKLWYVWAFEIPEHRRVSHGRSNLLFWKRYLHNLRGSVKIIVCLIFLATACVGEILVTGERTVWFDLVPVKQWLIEFLIWLIVTVQEVVHLKVVFSNHFEFFHFFVFL